MPMRHNQLHTTAARSDLERRPLRSGLNWELLTQQPSHCEASRIVQFKKCDHRAASRMRKRRREKTGTGSQMNCRLIAPTLGEDSHVRVPASVSVHITRLVGGGGHHHSAFRRSYNNQQSNYRRNSLKSACSRQPGIQSRLFRTTAPLQGAHRPWLRLDHNDL